MSALERADAVPPETTLAVDPATLDMAWSQANEHMEAGRYAEALPLYLQLTEIVPGASEVWCNLGALLDILGHGEEAITAMRNAVAADPLSALAHRNLAGMLENTGDLEGAVAHYSHAVDIDPDRLEALRGLGCALNLAQRSEDAKEILQRAVRIAPEDPQSHFYLGNALSALGERRQALRHMRTAYQSSGDPRAGCNLANLLIDLERLTEAEGVTREITEAHPEHAPAWNALGGALLKLGRTREAREALEQALTVDPEFAPAMHGLARCLFKLGDLDGSLELFGAVVDLSPDNINARVDAARALQHLGRFEEAEQWQRSIVAIAPDDPGAWCDLAVTLKNLERGDDVRIALKKALELDPEYAKALVLEAGQRIIESDSKGAIQVALDALRCASDDTDVINAIGGLFEQSKNEDLAIMVYREVLKLKPDNAFAAARLFDLSLSVCDWSNYEEDYRAQLGAIEAAMADGEEHRGIDVFNLQALPIGYDVIARAARHAAAAIAHDAQRHAPVSRFSIQPRRREKIRLGYALAYTYFHSLPMVLKEVIERHDTDRFELFGYSLNKCDGSSFSEDYRGAFDHFADIPPSAPYAAAKRMHDDDLDVLIDVSGLTGQTCMPMMSFRPAPLQMHAFGYSITTGADYIDYLITDRTYIPEEWARLGSEKLIYMPDTFMPTVQPKDPAGSTTRSEHDLPDDAVVFCNFNHPCKFEPRIFDAWMTILAAIPDSVLWFGSWMQNTQKNLRREAQARGIDGDRLVFANIVGHEEHLRRLPLADIALDNYYHGGGVTTLDALWAGVPLLSVTGIAPGGRLGATLSRAAGVPELVCRDLDDYVARAIVLARDQAARHALRDKLLEQRSKAPLFDTERFTRNLERGIETAWETCLAGEPPRLIDIAGEA